MRLPKTVNIGGKKYTVRRDESQGEGYGHANIETRIIIVGSKDRRPELAFETFIHEVVEASLLENEFSYHRNANPDIYFYKMDHAEMSRLAGDVACAIRPMMKGTK